MSEPHITINGTRLTAAQAMALRVAASSCIMEMAEPEALGADEDGRAMAAAYQAPRQAAGS